MKRKELYDKLLELAREIFDRVEVAAGDFQGGICRVRNETHLVLNRSASLDQNLRILANALASADTDQRFLLPAVREGIEQYTESR